MAEEYNCRIQMHYALKVLRMIFITHDQAAKVEHPGKETFDFPTLAVTAQGAAVLRGHTTIDFVGRDQLRAVILHELFIHSVAVVRLVANQTLWNFGHQPEARHGPLADLDHQKTFPLWKL